MNRIRRLLPMDVAQLPTILSIERAAYEFPWSEANFRDSLASGYAGWVLLDDEQIGAYALMCMAMGEAQLLNICVDPGRRRQGLARLMMDHLLCIAVAADMEMMLLEVRESNAAAISLYESYGFTRIGLRRRYYRTADGRGEDARVLSLRLQTSADGVARS